MFQGKFRDEISKLMDLVETVIESDLSEYYTIESITPGNHNIKIRISDKENGQQTIINCVFRYRHDDERYGHIDIDLNSSGLSKRPYYYYVGKFHIIDYSLITENIVRGMMASMKEME